MTPRTLKPRTIVRLTWLDSASHHGWQALEDDITPAQIASVGLVVTCNDKFLAITSSIALDTKYAYMDPLCIPWGCIQSCRPLEASND